MPNTQLLASWMWSSIVSATKCAEWNTSDVLSTALNSDPQPYCQQREEREVTAASSCRSSCESAVPGPTGSSVLWVAPKRSWQPCSCAEDAAVPLQHTALPWQTNTRRSIAGPRHFFTLPIKGCLCCLRRGPLCPLKLPTFCTLLGWDHKPEKLVFIHFPSFISLFATLSVEEHTKLLEAGLQPARGERGKQH